MLIFTSLKISAQTQQEKLVGTWIFNYELSIANVRPEAKKTLDLMSDLYRKKIERAYKGRKIIFRPDGSFTQELSDGTQINGLWTLENDANDIVISILQKQIQILEIKLLSSTSLIVALKSDDNMKPIISEWYFSKN